MRIRKRVRENTRLKSEELHCLNHPAFPSSLIPSPLGVWGSETALTRVCTRRETGCPVQADDGAFSADSSTKGIATEMVSVTEARVAVTRHRRTAFAASDQTEFRMTGRNCSSFQQALVLVFGEAVTQARTRGWWQRGRCFYSRSLTASIKYLHKSYIHPTPQMISQLLLYWHLGREELSWEGGLQLGPWSCSWGSNGNIRAASSSPSGWKGSWAAGKGSNQEQWLLTWGLNWSLLRPGLGYLQTYFWMLLKWSPREQKTVNSTPNERPKSRGIKQLYLGKPCILWKDLPL